MITGIGGHVAGMAGHDTGIRKIHPTDGSWSRSPESVVTIIGIRSRNRSNRVEPRFMRFARVTKKSENKPGYKSKNNQEGDGSIPLPGLTAHAPSAGAPFTRRGAKDELSGIHEHVSWRAVAVALGMSTRVRFKKASKALA